MTDSFLQTYPTGQEDKLKATLETQQEDTDITEQNLHLAKLNNNKAKTNKKNKNKNYFNIKKTK